MSINTVISLEFLLICNRILEVMQEEGSAFINIFVPLVFGGEMELKVRIRNQLIVFFGSVLVFWMMQTVCFAALQTLDGSLDVEIENLNFDSNYLEVITDETLYSNGAALGVLATDTTQPKYTDPAHVDLSFQADKTATYYLWMRHTASVANMSGQSFFLSIDYSSYNFFQLTAEASTPKWVQLGAIAVTSGDIASVRIRRRQKASIGLDRYIVTTNSSYIPTDNDLGLTPAGMSSAYKVATTNGCKMFEAESVTVNNSSAFSKFYSIEGLSNSSGLVNSQSYVFDSSNKNDGQLEFNFTPDKDATYSLWARVYPNTVSKSISVSFDRSIYSEYKFGSPANEYEWRQIGTVKAKSGYAVNVRLRAVVGYFKIDNFVITDSIFKTPSGKSGTIIEKSTVIPDNLYTKPTITPTGHPRLYFTSNDISTILSNTQMPENINAYLTHKENVKKGLESSFTGSLSVPATGKSNSDDEVLGIIEALAFEYATTDNAECGNKAVSAIKNYLNTIVYIGNYTGTYIRPAGNLVFTVSEVYDWCYDLLGSSDDKKNIIDDTIEIIAAGMGVKWPPTSGGAITGLVSEAQIQRDVLAFAVAVADERDDIYNAVVGRVIDEFAPAKKYIFQSHMNSQGSHYASYRGQWDIIATRIMDKIGYPNIYGENLEYVPFWTVYARRPDGQVLRDGDSPGDGEKIGSYYSLTYNQRLMTYTASYYKNAYLKREAAKLNKAFASFGYGHAEMSPVEFLCFNDPLVESENVSELPLTKYFGSPVGAMIARTDWKEGMNSDAVVAFMKVKEVWFANHDHLDSGHFELYYKGILASDSGRYAGSTYGTDHDLGYNKRSVAHNTIVVRDGNDYTYNGITTSDGGQVPIDEGNESGDLSDFIAGGDHNTGSVEEHQIGPNPIKPEYTYLKGDITGAYSSSSVSDFERSFMFLNFNDDEHPAALMVFDRVVSTDASFEKAWLLHGVNEPTVNGNQTIFRNTDNGYNGKLTLDTLLPSADNTDINVVGGTGYEAYDGNTNHPSTVAKVTGSGLTSESEGYRIEIIPKTPEKTNYFLNVIQVGDAVTSNSANGTTPFEVKLIETDSWAGAQIADRVVMFRKNKGKISGGAVRFSFSGTGTYKVAVADLGIGTWNVRYGGDDGEIIAMVEVTEEGGVGYFEGPAGNYKLAYKSETISQEPIEVNIDKSNAIDIRMNDKYVYTPVSAVSEDDVILAPITCICGLIEAECTTTATNAVAKRGSNELIFNVNSDIAYLNGNKVKLEHKVTVTDGYIMVPLKLLCDSLYCQIENDETAKCVNLAVLDAVNFNNDTELNLSSIGGIAGTYTKTLATVFEASGIYTITSASSMNSRLTLKCGNYSNSTEKILHHSVIFKNEELAKGEQFIYLVAARSDSPNSQKQLRFLSDGTVRDASDNVLMGYEFGKEYKIDLLFNLMSGHIMCFINGRFVTEAAWENYATGSGLSSICYEFNGTKGDKMVLKDFVCEIYNSGVSMLQVARKYFGTGISADMTNRYYGTHGTSSPTKTSVAVNDEGSSGLTENNKSGYTVTALGNSSGALRMEYNITAGGVIHHSSTFTYNEDSVGDYSLGLRCDDTNTDGFITFCEDGNITGLSGNFLMTFDKGTDYDIDFIVNTETGEVRVYINKALQYVMLWDDIKSVSVFNEIRYVLPANAIGKTITLKNLITRVFNYSTTELSSQNVASRIGKEMLKMEKFISVPSYNIDAMSITVKSDVYGEFSTGKLLYALYDSSNNLISTEILDINSNDTCVFNLYKSLEENMTLKVFAWDNLSELTPIAEKKIRTIKVN